MKNGLEVGFNNLTETVRLFGNMVLKFGFESLQFFFCRLFICIANRQIKHISIFIPKYLSRGL